MQPISKQARAFLALIHATGGWALPERGGMWRGADGTRLHLQGKPYKDPQAVARLVTCECLQKMPAAEIRAKIDITPEWFSPNRPAYRITETGEKERLGYQDAT